MLGLFYSILLLLTAAGLIGGLMGWRTLARVKRLERALAQMQRTQNAARSDVRPATVADEVEPAPPQELPDSPETSGASTSKNSYTATASTASDTPSALRQLAGELRQHWMIWLGGLCVALAGIFLVKYSIDAGLLGPSARIFAACVTGVTLHIIALYLRRRTGDSHPAFAALAGGASITLYSAMLAALHLYQLIEPGTALLLLALIALATMALALLHGPVLAIIGILGAYTVPILVANDEGDIVSSLIYATIISGAALLLMRHVYRRWLWFGMLAGALGWWLISFANIEAAAVRGYYLAVLAYGMLAIPTLDWRLIGSTNADPSISPVTLGRLREQTIALPLSTLSLLLVTAAWAISIAHTGFTADALWHWPPLVLVLLLAARNRPDLTALPWLSLAGQWFAWLASALTLKADHWQIETLGQEEQMGFLWFALTMAVIYSAVSLWIARGRPYSNARDSLIALAPPCWLALAYLLVTDLSSIWQWSLISLAIGLIYIILSQYRLRHAAGQARANPVWLILA
ncbi:MAG: DUF2339 domain-containing protein, partial [Halieaceae bacterium]